MKVPELVLAALRAATTDGCSLYLQGPQMDPRFYQQVNEVIEGAGGRWDGSVQAHVFNRDAAEAIAPVLATGHVTTVREARQASQFFPTPAPVVARLVELARLEPGMSVLEPSAGRGAIAATLVAAGAVVDCIEFDADHAAALRQVVTVRQVTVADFLTVPPQPLYDRVVMNPPFTRQADIAHVTHALRFLKPDGLLVAVMSFGTTFQGGDAPKFRALVEARGGTVEALPEGAFKESATAVDTIVVTIPATRPADARPVVWPTREAPAVVEALEFEDPAVIAAQIVDDLRSALAAFEDVARALAQPSVPVQPAPVTRIPRQSKPTAQLSFDDLDATA